MLSSFDVCTSRRFCCLDRERRGEAAQFFYLRSRKRGEICTQHSHCGEKQWRKVRECWSGGGWANLSLKRKFYQARYFWVSSSGQTAQKSFRLIQTLIFILMPPCGL
jgi:hypothetical protein